MLENADAARRAGGGEGGASRRFRLPYWPCASCTTSYGWASLPFDNLSTDQKARRAVSSVITMKIGRVTYAVSDKPTTSAFPKLDVLCRVVLRGLLATWYVVAPFLVVVWRSAHCCKVEDTRNRHPLCKQATCAKRRPKTRAGQKYFSQCRWKRSAAESKALYCSYICSLNNFSSPKRLRPCPSTSMYRS